MPTLRVSHELLIREPETTTRSLHTGTLPFPHQTHPNPPPHPPSGLSGLAGGGGRRPGRARLRLPARNEHVDADQGEEGRAAEEAGREAAGAEGVEGQDAV